MKNVNLQAEWDYSRQAAFPDAKSAVEHKLSVNRKPVWQRENSTNLPVLGPPMLSKTATAADGTERVRHFNFQNFGGGVGHASWAQRTAMAVWVTGFLHTDTDFALVAGLPGLSEAPA